MPGEKDYLMCDLTKGNILKKAYKIYLYSFQLNLSVFFFLLGTSSLLQVGTTNMLENHFLASMMLCLILKIKQTHVQPGQK